MRERQHWLGGASKIDQCTMAGRPSFLNDRRQNEARKLIKLTVNLVDF
jgi:hypothetical protein